jgi:hypothetical protein
MQRYQIHTFDMGHVNATEFIEAVDDAGAVEKAKSLFVECEREVWAGSRFVARLADDFKVS